MKTVRIKAGACGLRISYRRNISHHLRISLEFGWLARLLQRLQPQPKRPTSGT